MRSQFSNRDDQIGPIRDLRRHAPGSRQIKRKSDTVSDIRTALGFFKKSHRREVSEREKRHTVSSHAPLFPLYSSVEKRKGIVTLKGVTCNSVYGMISRNQLRTTSISQPLHLEQYKGAPAEGKFAKHQTHFPRSEGSSI